MTKRAGSAAPTDVNASVGGYLRDLAFLQTVKPKQWAYARAAAAILALEQPLTDFWQPGQTFPKVPGIGPSSARVITEVLETGASPTVERAVDASGKRADVDARRAASRYFLSRAAVVRILRDPSYDGPSIEHYRADFQMHTTWSDGAASLADMALACQARGYTFAAVSDHSHGLKVARGMTIADARRQRREVERVNAASKHRFRFLHGIEANIGAGGELDLDDEAAAFFEIVLAAPHSALRKADDQTARLMTAVTHPAVRILAHPRGRVSGKRAGLVADWPKVFAACATAASRSRSTAIRRARTSISPWPRRRSRRDVSSPSTATRMRPTSCTLPTRHSRTRAWPRFPWIAS